MKKIILLSAAFLIFINSFAITSITFPGLKLNASEILIPVGKTGKKISLMELSTISLENAQQLTGRKMNFFERMSFKITQRKLKKNIHNDGTIDSKRITALVRKRGGETGFHAGGFALGFFLGVAGVLIAYILDDDYKKNRIKWAWIGFGLGFVLSILLIVAILSSGNYYY